MPMVGPQSTMAATRSRPAPAKPRLSVRQATKSAAMPGAMAPMVSLRPKHLALPAVAICSASLAEMPPAESSNQK